MTSQMQIFFDLTKILINLMATDSSFTKLRKTGVTIGWDVVSTPVCSNHHWRKGGAHSVARPEYEIQAIVAASTAGESDNEIRALVKQLIEHRKKLPADVQAMLSHHQPVEAASLPPEAAYCLSRGPDDWARIEKGGNSNED